MIWVKDWNEDREDHDVDIFNIIQKVQDTVFYLEVDEKLRFWCLCMAIIVSVHYSGGLLPDIILLTLCDYIGEPFWYREKFLFLQPMFQPKSLTIFKGGCSECLDVFIPNISFAGTFNMPTSYQ